MGYLTELAAEGIKPTPREAAGPLADFERLRAQAISDLVRTGAHRAVRMASFGNVVVLAIAIRNGESGAILIPKANWDGVRFLEVLDQHAIAKQS